MGSNRDFFLFTLIVVLIFALVSCPCGKRDSGAQRTVNTILQIDTIRIRDTVYYPKPYSINTISVPTIIDTAAVLEDYFSEKQYRIDYNDTLIKASTQIKLLNNAIESAILDYQLLQKHTITTIDQVNAPQVALFIGGGISYSIPERKPGMELNATLRIKSHHLILGYDFINQAPRIGWQYQILKTKN